MALADNALTNVATMESVLGLASGSADTALQRAINQASAIAEEYCGRIFYRNTAISEKHPGQMSPILTVDRPPLNSITSVTYLAGTAEDSGTTEIHDADAGEIYRIEGVWGSVDSIFPDASGTVFSGHGRKVWTIVYDGGWYTPKQDDDDVAVTRNLPYDLEFAAIQIAVYVYRNEGRASNVVSESLMEASQRFASGTGPRGGESVADWLRSHIPGAALTLDKYTLGKSIIG